jgi:hypothetical protein
MGLARVNPSYANLSNTITLETKALTSRTWETHSAAIAPKSSSMQVRNVIILRKSSSSLS